MNVDILDEEGNDYANDGVDSFDDEYDDDDADTVEDDGDEDEDADIEIQEAFNDLRERLACLIVARWPYARLHRATSYGDRGTCMQYQRGYLVDSAYDLCTNNIVAHNSEQYSPSACRCGSTHE